MVYWFTDYPDDPVRFTYDTAQYKADEVYLTALVAEIEGLSDDFSLTAQERRCRYCRYRSLCQRGVRAGALDEIEDETELGDDLDISLDLEQIAEIEY